LKHLIPGLRKFSQDIYPQQKKLFQELSKGQSPHTLMITCSDSRIDPNLVTQTEPGEIFVIRNAGNIIPPFGSSVGGEEATIEYAIEVLGVKHIVVCGHSQCGAMAAIAQDTDLTALPSVKKWLGHAEATKRRCQHMECQGQLDKTIEENVLVQVENLKTHPAVSAALRNGTVDIFGWVYHFETGGITVYDPKQNKFVSSESVANKSETGFKELAIS
jgi:carbonic anhydrase